MVQAPSPAFIPAPMCDGPASIGFCNAISIACLSLPFALMRIGVHFPFFLSLNAPPDDGAQRFLRQQRQARKEIAQNLIAFSETLPTLTQPLTTFRKEKIQ
jgi:hypothetical protein